MKHYASATIVEIYPREGTETKTQINNHLISLVEIYPREGTETMGRRFGLLGFCWLKFIPVRGAETSMREVL